MTCSPRILVVDDNESGRYALARYLRFAGFTVEEVGTGAACFRCASASECDLVLLDIHLPDISGTEVCRQLKAHPKTADIPVIQISAMFTHSHDRIAGLESGADAYLTAPFEPREVMAQVQALLRARRAEAALRKSEQQYRLLFDKNPDAVLSLDPSGRFTLTNPACEEILGYTAAELLEKTFMELCAPERAAEARAHFKRALQGFDFSGLLTTIIKKDGSRAELLISGQPILEDKNQSVVAVYCTARDVTSINRAQAARRELQRKVNSALLAGEVGMFEWLVEEDRLWGDRNFTRLFGIGSEHASLPLAEYLKVIHPDDRPRVQMRVKQTVETGCPYEAEYRIVNNGGTCSVIARGTGERDQAGKVVRLHGVILDTTPLKHARESLQRSSERLRLLSETVSALLRNPDPQSVVQHLCDDVRRFLKCEVFFNFLLEPGTNRLKLNACGGVDPRIARKVESLELGQSLCGTAAKDACRVVAEQIPSKPDPRSMLVSSLGVRAYACHPLMDQQGGVIGTLSFGATDRDRFAEEDLALMKSVADHVAVAMLRCRTEESLREAVADYQQQVQLFEGVASTTLDFVYIFDRQGRFVYANRRLLEVWGMQLPDIIGKTCRELGYEQWHHDMHMREIEKVIRTKAPIKGEVPFKAPLTGIFGVYEYIFTPVLGADGEVEVIAGTTRDVTQRKQFQSELERLVQERTVKLQEAVSELEHFSYSITHDMRAPLRAMRGFSEVLREAVGSSGNPELMLCVNRIMISAKRMDMLITDALNYSKTVRGEFPLSFVNIDRLLREMLETYPEFLAHKGNIRIRGELHPVLGNEAALIQCFSNLVGNALKFAAPERLPEVAVWSELVANPCQTAPAGPSPADPSNANGGPVAGEPWVRIWVEDNGIGIGSRMLPRIFKMFSRGTTRHEGTGIGLALVRKVVERLGGRVGVDSEEGKGSRFWFELPSPECITASSLKEPGDHMNSI